MDDTIDEIFEFLFAAFAGFVFAASLASLFWG